MSFTMVGTMTVERYGSQQITHETMEETNAKRKYLKNEIRFCPYVFGLEFYPKIHIFECVQ
jgi:hypothetical protein